MEACPTCRAPWRGDRTCHRCDTDLERLLEVEAAADVHSAEALAALASGDLKAAAHAAEKASLLDRERAARAAALVALARGEHAEALAWWAVARTAPKGTL